MTALPIPITHAVVLGGNGAVGSLFCAQLAPILKTVTSIDIQSQANACAGNVQYIHSDVSSPNEEMLDVLANADLIILALPEELTFSIWPNLVTKLSPNSLVVDTLSIKNIFVNTVLDNPPPDEYISINPMFAPSLGFAGQNVAVIEISAGLRAQAFLSLLKSWGCHLSFLSADEHDRYAAMLQAATHAAILAFGITLKKLNYDLSTALPIMPPPHRAMLAMLARILNASPEVYWDIQAGNSYAPEARQTLAIGIEELSMLFDGENREGFVELLNSMRALFGTKQLEDFNRHCVAMFKATHVEKGN